MLPRLLLAGVLLVIGIAITSFGVMTAVYRDPLGTTLILLGVGLPLLAAAVRLAVRRRR